MRIRSNNAQDSTKFHSNPSNKIERYGFGRDNNFNNLYFMINYTVQLYI